MHVQHALILSIFITSSKHSLAVDYTMWILGSYLQKICLGLPRSRCFELWCLGFIIWANKDTLLPSNTPSLLDMASNFTQKLCLHVTPLPIVSNGCKKFNGTYWIKFFHLQGELSMAYLLEVDESSYIIIFYMKTYLIIFKGIDWRCGIHGHIDPMWPTTLHTILILKQL